MWDRWVFPTSPPTHPTFHFALAYFNTQILNHHKTTIQKQHACPLSQIPLCLSLSRTRPFLFLLSVKTPWSRDGLCLQGGGDCIQANGGVALAPNSNSNHNQTTASASNDSLTMTEHQVAKLMEEDMGSAMQYLQGKGLCLMPISLATAISTATCHTRNPLISAASGSTQTPTNAAPGTHANPAVASNGEGPSSPSMSVLTVQSAVVGNDGAVKDAASVSKPWRRRLGDFWCEIDKTKKKHKVAKDRKWRVFL